MKTITSAIVLADAFRTRQYDSHAFEFDADYERIVMTGAQCPTMSDSDEETYAKLSHRFEPGCECIARKCGCRTVFRRPYAYGDKTPGATQTRGFDCEPIGGGALALTHNLMVATNAILYARDPAVTIRAHRHGILAFAGLPFDDSAILEYFKSSRYDGMRGTREPGDIACALYAVMQLTGFPLHYRILKRECPELAPYASVGVFHTESDGDRALADYKPYVEIK